MCNTIVPPYSNTLTTTAGDPCYAHIFMYCTCHTIIAWAVRLKRQCCAFIQTNTVFLSSFLWIHKTKSRYLFTTHQTYNSNVVFMNTASFHLILLTPNCSMSIICTQIHCANSQMHGCTNLYSHKPTVVCAQDSEKSVVGTSFRRRNPFNVTVLTFN